MKVSFVTPHSHFSVTGQHIRPDQLPPRGQNALQSRVITKKCPNCLLDRDILLFPSIMSCVSAAPTVRLSDGGGRKNRCTFLRPWCAKRLDEEVPLFARIWRGGRICLAVKGHILELAMDDH